MKRVWETVRSALLWAITLLHFGAVVPVLIVLGIFLSPRKHDWLQRGLCRRIAFLSGARLQIERGPGFDAQRTSFFVVNHVNLFDPFLLYCAIPQHVRGWELESHFKIPVYGWLMRRFGNVPVPDVRRPADLKRMWRMTREALDGGTSLIIFPEGKRTRDGRLGEFEAGGFRLAQQLGVPIVPVTLVGSFQHFHTGHWMLRPCTIRIVLHDTIDTTALKKEDVPELRDKVHAIIKFPLGET
jgi:1-acyl-sn-glycerol-3-phosphate acyltransferase